MANSHLQKSSVHYRKRGSSSRRKKKLRQKPIIDAATLAASIQLKEEKKEFIYSLMALFMKSGLLAIGIASLLNLGFAAHQRINRHFELSSVLRLELAKFIRLQRRFDSLFTIGGKDRLIGEQEQLIAPNTRRIIWR